MANSSRTHGSATSPASPQGSRIQCRRIAPGDDAALANLLARGFPAQSHRHWVQALARVRTWTEAEALPGTGFVLDDGGSLVGCLLTLYGAGGHRCNMSSWYVEEGYRRYGSMLVSVALRDRSLTYFNVSPERHTQPIIEAQGFRRYTKGVILAVPLLSLPGRAKVSRDLPPGFAADPDEVRLVADHARLGCLTFWCLSEGMAVPIVATRRVIAGRLPVAQVVYMPREVDWPRIANAVGRALARHGLFLLLLDAEGPIAGLAGRFLPGRMPKYVRGPQTPHCGDLAYTEIAILGT